MRGIVYLIGGGEIAKGETQLIDDDIKKSTPRNSSFVFFPTAAGNSPGYRKIIESVFGDYFNCWTAIPEQSRSAVEKAIQLADVIYLGGGKTELLMKFFVESDFVRLLREALKRRAIIVGMSAGAQALSSWYIEEVNNEMKMQQGWGVVSTCCLVHAHEDSAHKALALYRENSKTDVNSFIAMGEKAAWRLDASGERKIGQGPVWYAKAGSLDTLVLL